MSDVMLVYAVISACILGCIVLVLLIFSPLIAIDDPGLAREMWRDWGQAGLIASFGWPLLPFVLIYGLWRLIRG